MVRFAAYFFHCPCISPSARAARCAALRPANGPSRRRRGGI